MIVKSHNNEVKLIFNYNEDLVDKLRTIPRARFNPDLMQSYWTLPASSLLYAKQAQIISEGSLFPKAKEHIDKKYFGELHLEIKKDRLKASGPIRALTVFTKSILDLCSYEEKENETFVIKSLAKTIYFKNQTVVISFPAGLGARVTDFCNYINPKYLQVYEQDKIATGSLNIDIHNFQPRPYQQAVVNMISNRAIPNRATLVMATGAGKTKLSAMIIANLGVPTIFYVYSDTLLKQTAEVYEELLQQEIGRVGGRYFSIKPITIASLQTVYSCYGKQDKRWDKLKKYLKDVQLMFVDEGHMLGADTVYSVAQLTDTYYSYSLTATPFREDGKEIFIEAATGPVFNLIKEEELVAGGYILPVEIEIYSVMHEPLKKKMRYHALYEKEIIDHWDRHRAVINAVKRYAGKQVLILVKEIRHGKKIQENLLCPFIHGKTPAAERNQTLEKFKNKEINFLIASSILKQGIDIPEAEVLVLAHGGTSSVELLQKIGRVRRPAENKTKGIVVDFYDHIKPVNKNDVFKKQAKKRLALYKQKNFLVNWE